MARRRLSRKPMPKPPLVGAIKNRKRRRRGLNRRMGRLGISEQRVAVPLSLGTIIRGAPGQSHSIIETADELLSIVTVDPTIRQGAVIFNYLLNPSIMVNTRLRRFALIYAQYRFIKCEIEFVPAAPSTADGSLCIALDKDVSRNMNAMGTTDGPLAYAMDIDSSVTGPLYQPMVAFGDCKMSDSRQSNYMTDPTQSVAQSAQFRVLVVQGIKNTSLTGGYSFMLRVRYSVRFSQPENLPFGNLGIASQAYTAASGSDYTLTSDSGVFSAITLSPTLPTGASVNGAVYICNPQICQGLESGGSCVGAVVLSTTSAGASPRFAAFKDYELTQSNTQENIGNGAVQGSGASTKFPSNVNFIPVGQCAMGYHT